MENSFWILNNESEDYSALDKSIDVEYLIVGAGLTGLHTAYLLSDISSNIVIVDANKVGSGSSGRNTGKVTSSHGLIYDYISQKYGDKSSKLYYEANEEGLRLIKDIVQKYNIDCNFETVPNYIFTTEDEGLEEMNRGGLWHVPKWFYRVFHQFLTPICIIVFLAIFTKDYWTAGNFKITPSYIEGIEYMAPWVNAARLVVVVVLIIGFAQTYRAIKRKYKDEIESNKANA